MQANDKTENFPDEDINTIIKDPFAWAEKHAENIILDSMDDFLTAKELGMEFAKENLKGLK